LLALGLAGEDPQRVVGAVEGEDVGAQTGGVVAPTGSGWRAWFLEPGGGGRGRVGVPVEPKSASDSAMVSGPAPFEEFYRREWVGAVRLAHLLTGVDAVAEDLAQEALTRVGRRWASVENGPAYLRRSVVNVCRSWQRRHSREEALLRQATAGVAGSTSLGADEVLDAVDALPFRQRTVLVLRYYHDLSEREIAHALGCRPGTVKSLASRALDRLKTVIDR
jgi:RNA polymerase sigma-70 factor (sigma-E family)